MAKAKAKTKAKKKTAKVEAIPKILIGIPILAWTHEFAMSFLEFWTDLMTYAEGDRRFHVGYKFMYRKPVHMAEEALAQFAVETGCTHLLLMDDDIYDTKAEDLFMLLDADKDVIGGIMHTQGFPHAMCAFRKYDAKTKVSEQSLLKGPARLYEVPLAQRVGIQRVDLIPFAFTLIKTRVFKNIEKPWFECNEQAPTDSWFADRMLKGGFEYYAHFGVWLNHKGIRKETIHLNMQMGVLENQLKNTGQMIMLTPIEMKRHEAMMTLKLQQAEANAKIKATMGQIFFEKNGGSIGKKIKAISDK